MALIPDVSEKNCTAPTRDMAEAPRAAEELPAAAAAAAAPNAPPTEADTEAATATATVTASVVATTVFAAFAPACRVWGFGV